MAVVPVLVLALGLGVIAATLLLQHRSTASRDAELKLANVEIELGRLQNAPFRAARSTGGSPEVARTLLHDGKGDISATLGDLLRDSPPSALRQVPGPLRQNFATLDKIYAIGASTGTYGARADHLAASSARTEAITGGLLTTAGGGYHDRASRSQTQATVGSGGAILLLLCAFAISYGRSARARSTAECLARENERLLGESRREALRDALTGLRNRRALIGDLTHEESEDERILALFDLDGFKQYNDTFGHPAGDALLTRLGERLERAVDGRATAYRMGGDEFCVITPIDQEEEIVSTAAEALSERGDAFAIGCSYGVVRIPAEAPDAADALRMADQRMYEHKAERSSASQESTDVLLQVLSERSIDLHDHLNDVAELAGMTARALGFPEHEVRRVELAAALHDVGKTAIPDAILDKPGKLDDEEWDFIRRHTLIGERIVRAAPSLAHTAELVRSSHERFDGAGYPDGLVDDEIPLGASIIAVADAFHAMVTERPYRAAISTEEAFAELRRCSGTQFDPRVVAVFRARVQEQRSARLQVA